MPPFILTRLNQQTSRSSGEKETLFKAADKPNASKKTLQDNKNFLETLRNSDSESSLSDVSSRGFGDVLPPSPKRRKVDKTEEEDDDEIDWEDAIEHTVAPSNGVSGDLDLTLDKNDSTVGSFTDLHDRKKGPSKIERQIRVSTHRMHVQFLLFHNLLRSRWACDSEVQRILLDQLPEKILIEVDKWRIDSGFNARKVMSKSKKSTPNGRRTKNRVQDEKNQRDWGKLAERQEKELPNMSAGDPIIRLLKCLSAYWKKKFSITASGLRKQGYRTLPVLEEHIASFRKRNHDPEAHGERIDGIEGFRKAAKTSEGSRDIGAQLFTALLRGLGIEARLVANLQPIGFGWSKNEDASVEKGKEFGLPKRADDSEEFFSPSNSNDNDQDIQEFSIVSKTNPPRRLEHSRCESAGAKDSPIDLLDDIEQYNDNDSVKDITPDVPRKKNTRQYDQDLPAPNYWTEVASPITFHIYPVDPLVSKIPVITSSEYFPQFEPRGGRADRAKQVFAYVIAYSPDGTAKDVTTRYLKRRLWPGKTKGVRLPVEKIPLYNRNGKIKKYEEYDWFKSVLSGYNRPYLKRSAVDDLEEEKDLKPANLEKKEANIREDTLQFYKTSAEFVLERHLRREEAIKPGSKAVRTFISGKGKDAKKEPVFRRRDIEVCRSGESWHKEGRTVKPGEHPLKMVPIRAVTLTRKREIEEAERDSGEKQKQGLYAREQTDWIVPPPIENGRIPKNAYGNIDCFVPTMVPQGAVHIPLKKTVIICKKLGIDYAEAVTGFEFGNKMAVPVIEGVVVAQQHESLVIGQWEKDEKERKIKEEGKREKMALGTWRKWLMGLRIIQRVKEEYGGDADAHMKEEINPFTNQSKVRRGVFEEDVRQVDQEAQIDCEKLGGGFVIDNSNEDEGLDMSPSGNREARQHSGQLTDEGREDITHALHCGLAFLAADASSRQFAHASDLVNGKEGLSTPPSCPESTNRGQFSKKALAKSDSSQENMLEVGQKRKKRFSSHDSFNRETVRSVPKRNAARQSEIAVKSHYFDHESDGDGTANSEHNEDPQSEGIARDTFGGKYMKRNRSSKKVERVGERVKQSNRKY